MFKKPNNYTIENSVTITSPLFSKKQTSKLGIRLASYINKHKVKP